MASRKAGVLGTSTAFSWIDQAIRREKHHLLYPIRWICIYMRAIAAIGLVAAMRIGWMDVARAFLGCFLAAWLVEAVPLGVRGLPSWSKPSPHSARICQG